ncbi:MAG: heavy metal translocating P-type ATPase, partial [Firmicutes bacterium]|nr:heavy metal translocating P-type ATPase [Bacillota bacterium]
GIRSLREGEGLKVEVLDAAAVTMALLRGDPATASSIVFLLGVGEILEEWTYKESEDELAKTMSLNAEKVWLKTETTEILVPVTGVQVGDEIIVRTGHMIPLDGKVAEGEAMVNQASMTGESIPVVKKADSYVYAGTVVEEGELVIRVDKDAGSGRYDRIVKMIEESEKLKSASEDRAYRLADKLVPYSLGGTALVWLLSRNIAKAMAVLMVDFSCALKLSMPLAVLSAMRECSKYGITVKGGKFLEAVAEADTIVFDKTGTLTYAQPTVARVITFGENDEQEMLRIAACLEEHYPHSIANAVVEEARRRGLQHDEMHTKVEYVVAHGISSSIDGQKAIIGSFHFVFEDEAAEVPEEEMEKFRSLPEEYSHLFMAISGKLVAVICIHDPLRSEAAAAVKALHDLGLERVVMMTGDNERTAKAVAELVGVDEYHSEVLPEDKAAFIKAEKAAGRRVVMIGDGINDSPALSEADAGIAISTGAAIAREIADITISADDLFALVTLRDISGRLMGRIRSNYNTIIGFNLGLIILGVAGIIQPGTSALMHNASTIAIGLHSMTGLLPGEAENL